MSFLPHKRYRLLMVVLVLSLLILGTGVILLTQTFFQSIQPSLQQTSEQSGLNKDLLMLGITMVAGLPAIGIGTYFVYLGNQIRFTSPRMKGPLFMVFGGLIIVSCLVLPLLVWWMSETL